MWPYIIGFIIGGIVGVVVTLAAGFIIICCLVIADNRDHLRRIEDAQTRTD